MFPMLKLLNIFKTIENRQFGNFYKSIFLVLFEKTQNRRNHLKSIEGC